MKLLLAISAVLAFGLSSSSAQDGTNFLYETNGSIFYSYSNTYSPLPPNNTISQKSHQLQLEPELGWFVVPAIELLIDLHYSFAYSSYTPVTAIDNGMYILSSEHSLTHRIGLYLGFSYNIPVNEEITSFIGTKAGFSQTRDIYTYDGSLDGPPNIDTGWKPSEFSFPSFFCGAKFYFNPRWALVLKAQYIKTNRYQGYSNQKNDAIDFGLGIARSF
jgi:hypothetical protein